ncbi:MAG: histidinol-phosphate transaminase [Myxococcota bacterium]
MTRLIAPHILALHAYEPGKPEEELRRELGIDDVVKLASNENAYGPTPRVAEALASTDWNLHRYPDPRGHDLRQALSAHHGVAPDEIALGNGSNELIDLLCRVCAARGEHVVFGHPSFPCYRIGAVAQELTPTAVSLRDDLEWSVEDLVGAVRDDTRLLFVASPNNPTGSYLNRVALEQLLTQVPSDVLVVVDEAYFEYADASDYVPATELRRLRSRLIVLRTFSKAYGLAALRVGYALAEPELVHTINRLRAPFNVGTIGQRLACVALEDQAHVQEAVAATVHGRQELRSALLERGLRVPESQANFLLVYTPTQGRAVYEALLSEGVIVRPMAPPLTSAIRVTVGRPSENARFLEALDRVLERAR